MPRTDPKHPKRTTSTPNALANDSLTADEKELRDELEKHCRVVQSIKPTALATCTELKDSRNVKSRVADDASDDDVLKAAHTALLDAIEDQPTKTDRRIAEAVLAANDYDGKQVKEREEILKEHGISPKDFTRRRPKIVTRLVRFLGKPRTKPVMPDLYSYTDRVDVLITLARDANALHACFVASNFIREMNRYLADEDHPNHQYRRAPRVLVEALASAHMAMILSRHECLSVNRRREELLASFPGDLLGSLEATLCELDSLLPVGNDHRRLLCEYHFTGASITFERNLRDGITEIWHDWTERKMAWLFSRSEPPEGTALLAEPLKEITEMCEEVFGEICLLFQTVDLLRPPSIFEQSIADYYGVNSSAQFGELALSEHTAVFYEYGLLAHEV